MTTLTGKVAIVTGGNSGIGKAIVLALAEHGANIVIDYVANEQATEELEKQVAALGDQSIGVDADVSKVDDLERLVKSAVDAFGRLDIMVNNAGVETRTSILDTTEAQYEKVMEINLKSAFFGTQLAAKQMIAQGDGGRIINITSVHEDWPMPGNTPYCLSKGGMRMLTRTAGVELGPHGVTVVGVGPGAVATPINTSTMNDPAKMATLDAAIPLGRMAAARRDRQRGRLPRRRRRQLPHGDDGLRRRRASCTPARACSRWPRRRHGTGWSSSAAGSVGCRPSATSPTARSTSRVVDRRNHHLFQPLLYQVATGMLSPGQIAPPIRHVVRRYKNVRVELAEVTDFDLDRRIVHATSAAHLQRLELPYDSLIVAAGVNQSYFGHDELARYAPGMKTIDDAMELRRRIFGAFEMAAVDDRSRRAGASG